MLVMAIPIVIGTVKRPSKICEGYWRGWKSEKESRRQHCWDRPEYWEESWRPEETCCHSISSERPSTNAGVKSSLGVIIIIMIIDRIYKEHWRLLKIPNTYIKIITVSCSDIELVTRLQILYWAVYVSLRADILYKPDSFSYTYLSGRILSSSIWDFFGWSWVYFCLCVHFCSYKRTQKLWFSISLFTRIPMSTARLEVGIFGFRSSRRLGLLSN